jgi:hypothetical protein
MMRKNIKVKTAKIGSEADGNEKSNVVVRKDFPESWIFDSIDGDNGDENE